MTRGHFRLIKIYLRHNHKQTNKQTNKQRTVENIRRWRLVLGKLGKPLVKGLERLGWQRDVDGGVVVEVPLHDDLHPLFPVLCVVGVPVVLDLVPELEHMRDLVVVLRPALVQKLEEQFLPRRTV